jgi:hypothetical protein
MYLLFKNKFYSIDNGMLKNNNTSQFVKPIEPSSLRNYIQELREEITKLKSFLEEKHEKEAENNVKLVEVA